MRGTDRLHRITGTGFNNRALLRRVLRRPKRVWMHIMKFHSTESVL